MFVPASICILILVKIQLIANVETKTAFRIESFNDIVQNITHINSVLQEFIKNYKQLQDIYKSVEFTAKDDVSDYVKRNKDAKIEEEAKAAHLTSTTAKSPTITQVFYSEEHHWKDAYDENYYVDVNPLKKNITNQELKQSSQKMPPIFLPSILTTANERREPVTLSDVSGEAKHKETNELHDSTDVETQYNFNIPKTNRLIQSHERKERQGVRKVIKYESFDKDMWNSIIESRPIRYEYTRKNLRRNSNDDKKKTALVFLTNLKSPKNKLQSIAKLNNIESLLAEYSKGTYDGVTTSAIRIENAILRAKGKFGRACFQYVVRRCFLALNEASKKTCKELGCKKNFRKALKEHSKQTCQTEFYAQAENASTLAPKLRNASQTKSTVDDLTRRLFSRKKHKHESLPSLGHMYLSTCYPHMLPAAKRRKLDSAELPENFLQAIASAEIPDHSQEKSILRNKYERACKKESAKRCKTAGKKTLDVVCEKFVTECKKSMKKEFRKLISKFCMEAFGVKKKIIDDYEDDSCSSEIDTKESESNPFD